MTAEIQYLGNLRTESTHLQSGKVIVTDAPVDNHGLGEAFSPTDLVASALVSCKLTLAGIAANTHAFSIAGAHGSVLKKMGTDPRRIVGLDVQITFPAALTDKQRAIVEHAAMTCPVRYSIHPDIVLTVDFQYA